ncbi:hypothetical protein [Labrys neptuniae]|uniref:Uncharacterized protein n=1 Tax=Labrys neptuniae TaxID=376174 RepID=A0ABV3PX07_9HYPH
MNDLERSLALEEARRQALRDAEPAAYDLSGRAKREERRPESQKPFAVRLFTLARQAIATIRAGLHYGWTALDPLVHGFARAALWLVPRLIRLGLTCLHWLAFRKDETGHYYLAPWRGLANLVKLAILLTVMPLLLGALYYYGTWETYRGIYVPNAGVFINQSFVHPSGPGQVIAPRDEIFTVLGKQIEPDGAIVPIRFDIDSNFYFWFYHDATRPDLAAAKIDSQSPYGMKCTFEATGIYTRLPRYVRFWAVKWLDTRAEIVNVVKCEELTALPKAFSEEE